MMEAQMNRLVTGGLLIVMMSVGVQVSHFNRAEAHSMA